MKIKNLLSALAGCALFSLLTINAFAQVGRIEGDVVKGGEPVVGAEVQIVRTDIKGNYPVKTDKKGHFLHAGVPFVGTYTIIVSAEGCEPAYNAGVRPDREPLKFELRPGDGRKLTIDDLKKGPGGGGNTAGGAPPKAMSEAEKKKADEEYKKALAEREEAEKYNASIAVINVKLKEGNDAMAKGDLGAAVTAFKDAVTANPNIHISQGNLAIALQKRAVKAFNEGNRDAAKQDFLDSITACTKALEGLETQEKDTKAKNDPAQNKINRRTYLTVRAESEGILGSKFFDGPQAEAAVKDYDAVAELTEDPAKKKELPVKGAKVLFDAGQTDAAIAAYQKILDGDKDNIEAWYGIGLAYAQAGKFKESADSLQTFVEKAPGTDGRVTEAKTVIAELVRGNNLPPPKSLDDGKKRAAPAKKKP